LPAHDGPGLQSSLEDLAWFSLCRPWKEAVDVEAHRNLRRGQATDGEVAVLIYSPVAFEAEGLFSIRQVDRRGGMQCCMLHYLRR
jgi:hypothetical protein